MDNLLLGGKCLDKLKWEAARSEIDIGTDVHASYLGKNVADVCCVATHERVSEYVNPPVCGDFK